MAKKIRVDLLLIERGLVESRSLAQRMVMAGQVRADGQIVDKPSSKVGEDVELTIDHGPQFVSRGGEKLQAAFDIFDLEVMDLICADVGASTGGFTDCLLQKGAARVYIPRRRLISLPAFRHSYKRTRRLCLGSPDN